jgi:hypothetical protein
MSPVGKRKSKMTDDNEDKIQATEDNEDKIHATEDCLSAGLDQIEIEGPDQVEAGFSPGYVVKTKSTASNQKLFLNILVAKKDPPNFDFSTYTEFQYDTVENTLIIDKCGNTCDCYGIIIPQSLLLAVEEDTALKESVSLHLIKFAAEKYQFISDDASLKIPKVNKGFMGERFESFIIDDFTVSPLKSPTEQVKAAISESTSSGDDLSTRADQYVAPAISKAPTEETDAAAVETASAPAPAPAQPVTAPAAISESTSIGDHVATKADQYVASAPAVSKTPAEETAAATAETATTPAPAPVPLSAPLSGPTPVHVTSAAESELTPVQTSVCQEEMSAPAQVENYIRHKVLPPPPMKRGWLQKQGHKVKSIKTRFFVLDRGYIHYYVDEAAFPPFGTDIRGSLSLAGYVINFDAERSSGGSTQNVRISSMFSHRITKPASSKMNPLHIELLLEEHFYVHAQDLNLSSVPDKFLLVLEDVNMKQGWISAINAHTRYIESTLVDNVMSDPSKQHLLGLEDPTCHVSSFSPSIGGTGADADADSFSSMVTPYLCPSEKVVQKGLLGKPNPCGTIHTRMVVVTDKRRMVYVDPSSRQLKGKIMWSAEERLAVTNKGSAGFQLKVTELNEEWVYDFECFGTDVKSASDDRDEWVRIIEENL